MNCLLENPAWFSQMTQGVSYFQNYVSAAAGGMFVRMERMKKNCVI